MPTYNPLVPSGTVPLNEDYQNLQDNFNEANIVMGVDHLPFDNNTVQKGYHKSIHLTPLSTTATNPPDNQPINGYTATVGYGQVLSAQINDSINTDEALYFLTGGNRLMQLTRNFLPVISSNGYSFIAGGLIVQWGVINSLTFGTVTFSSANIAFPNNCFGVWTQVFSSGGTLSANQAGINVKVNSKLSFTWAFNGGSSSNLNGFYWVAIGN